MPSTHQLSLDDLPEFPPDDPILTKHGKCQLGNYTVIESDEELVELLDKQTDKTIVVDTETTAIDPRDGKMLLVAFAFGPDQAYVFKPSQVSVPLFLTRVIDWYGIYQNAKFDLKWFKHHYGIMPHVGFDTMLARQIGYAGVMVGGAGLEAMSKIFLGVELDKSTRKEFGWKGFAPSDKHVSYAADDVLATYQIAPILKARLEEVGLAHIWEDIEKPLLPVLVKTELHGVNVDVELLKKIEADLLVKIAERQEAVYKHLPRVNLGSPIQVKEAFAKLGVELKSTGEEVLAALLMDENQSESTHKAVKALLDLRETTKLHTTYVKPYLTDHLRGERVYPDFQQIGARSGRMSCKSPNVQNVPARDFDFRQVFVSPEGYTLVWSDLSQFEVRVLAEVTQDPTLVNAFRNGEDLHRAAAARLFRKPLDSITDKERNAAKQLQFAIIYGMGVARLSLKIELPRKATAKILDAYFNNYPRIMEYKSLTEHRATTFGEVASVLGRKRFFSIPSPSSHDYEESMANIKREAVNSTIQSSNADVIKIAQVLLHKRIKEHNIDGNILLTVHDEILTVVRDDQVAEMRELLHSVMVEASERVLKTVPAEADVKDGQHWSK